MPRRVKQTVRRSSKPMAITWTRFHLPPNQDWPSFPVREGGYKEARIGPLVNVSGVKWCKISIGRMVESPEEAVYMIEWETMEDLTNFLASPVCDEFLRHLPEREHGHEDAETESAQQSMGLLNLEEGNPTSSQLQTQTEREIAIARRRRRFLILTHFEGRQTENIEGRVTLSAFVVPAAPNEDDTDDSSLWMAYQRLAATFGEYDDFSPFDDEEPVPRYWHRGRVWFWAKRNAEEEEGISEEWMERTFGKGRADSLTTQSLNGGPGPKSLMCEFRVWDEKQKHDDHLEREEEHAKDYEVRQRWDQVTGEWMSDGRILAWRRERWDFQTVA